MLESFLQRAFGRMRGNDGFDWVTIVMPIVMALIQGCLDRQSLEAFVKGRRGLLQVAGLRARCRQAARRAGYRAARVGDAVCDAILAECDLMAKEGTMNSTEDIYQIVLDEVNAAMG